MEQLFSAKSRLVSCEATFKIIINSRRFLFLVGIAILMTGCIERKQVPHVLDAHDIKYPIQLNKYPLCPLFLKKEYALADIDSSQYWDIFQLNEAFGLSMKCSSPSSVAMGNIEDSITLKGLHFSTRDILGRDDISYRILGAWDFKFGRDTFLLTAGADKYQGGNRVIDKQIILFKQMNNTLTAICPPMVLDGGMANMQGTARVENCFWDINGDNTIDFLQWDERDSISMYSLLQDRFIRQKQFIKLYRQNGQWLLDQDKSDWPYPDIVKYIFEPSDQQNDCLTKEYY
ncbi:MAG: hypothetical protein J0L99_05920 [Chitinophagales bacterium]|nr:hypothetical protein [Chitinophagales bacterium]